MSTRTGRSAAHVFTVQYTDGLPVVVQVIEDAEDAAFTWLVEPRNGAAYELVVNDLMDGAGLSEDIATWHRLVLS